MTEGLSTKERKKEFDNIFKNKILPFFVSESFERHTKTSKRLFKDLGNELAVFIIFDYKSFGYGFYDITIVYFDAEIGNIYDDRYLAMAKIKIPTIEGCNKEELNLSADLWLKEIKSRIVPFIKKHATHKSILESNQFYSSKARENKINELLKKKSMKY